VFGTTRHIPALNWTWGNAFPLPLITGAVDGMEIN
jgi:hypothetical protein